MSVLYVTVWTRELNLSHLLSLPETPSLLLQSASSSLPINLLVAIKIFNVRDRKNLIPVSQSQQRCAISVKHKEDKTVYVYQAEEWSPKKTGIHQRNPSCCSLGHHHTRSFLDSLLQETSRALLAIKPSNMELQCHTAKDHIQDMLRSLCNLQFMWPPLHWCIHSQIIWATPSLPCCAAAYLWASLH